MHKQNGFLSVLPNHAIRKSAPELKAPLNCLDLMQRKAEQFPDLITARGSMPDFDSSVVLGLSTSPFQIEIILPSGQIQSFVLDKNITIHEVKEILWKNAPDLGLIDDHHLGLHDSLLLTLENLEIRKSHPIILHGYRQGCVIRLKVFHKSALESSELPTTSSASARVQSSIADSSVKASVDASIGAPSSSPPPSESVLSESFSCLKVPLDLTTVKQQNRRRPPSDVLSPATVLHSVRKEPSSVYCPILAANGYVIDEGMSLPLDPFHHSNMTMEDAQADVPYYYENFYGKDHFNWIGSHDSIGPIVLSIKEKPDTGNYRAIVWTKRGEEHLFLPSNDKSHSSKHLLRLLLETKKNLSEIKFELISSPALKKTLAEMELCQVISSYKFGVLLAKQGQTTEEEMFSNKDASPAFEEFLSFLGDKISLLGWKNYRGGLDTTRDFTGTHSLYTKLRNFEIMFHVSTMLPYTEWDKQQLERKRHIGNDIVVIVFQEDPETPYSPLTISSSFNHVFIVVNPLPPLAPDRPIRYRITTASKEGVRPWKPLMPSPAIFERGPLLKEFILTKLINAERAAYHAPAFGQKISRTRGTLLQTLIKDLTK